MSDFDFAVQNYDKQFTQSVVGFEQRKQVWECVEKLNINPSSEVLEINCGTGEDASRWEKLGHTIKATDISAQMIKKAKQKFPSIPFEELNFKDIQSEEGLYDVIFSNFGGLNCASSEEFKTFLTGVDAKLNPKGKLIMVIMGKKCLWDKLYIGIKKRSLKEGNRRNTNEPLQVMVDGVSVSTWYYSPKQIKEFVGDSFRLDMLKPIGLFVPPSYLAPFFENKPILFSVLKFLDKSFSFSFLSNRADHYFISFSKK